MVAPAPLNPPKNLMPSITLDLVNMHRCLAAGVICLASLMS